MEFKLKTETLVKSVELVKGGSYEIVAEMLTKKCEINRKGVFVTSSVLECANVLTEQRNQLAKLAPITDVSQVAEMAEYKNIYAQIQETRLVGVAVIDALKDNALREQQQWVKVRNALESAFEKAENYASENANFAKRKEQEAQDAKVANWLAQLHALNDFSKSAKDLGKMADDVFEAYLAMAKPTHNAKKEEAEAKAKAEKVALNKRISEAYIEFLPIGVDYASEDFESILTTAKTAYSRAKAEKDAQAERERKVQAEKDALRNARNAEIRPFIAFLDFAGDVVELTAEQFDAQLQKAKTSYEEDKARKDEEARLATIAKAEKDAQAERERAEKAKADALANAGDEEKFSALKSQLLAVFENAPEMTTEKGMAKVTAIKATIQSINF